ncbi:MAG: hypothetical protein DCC75_12455, partial [Proteobacteria bacterium]
MALIIAPMDAVHAEAAAAPEFAPEIAVRPVSNAGAFYEKNSARSVFDDHIKLLPQAEIKHFPDVPRPVEEGPKALSAVDQEILKAGAKESGVPAVDPASPDPVKEALMKQFGDPSGQSTLQVADNAPVPFKGMMAALEAGRDDLAFSYARQYAR